MKRLILLLMLLAAVRTNAQPLKPKPALMAKFSKAMLKEREKAAFGEKLAILLQPGKEASLEQTLKLAAKDPETFAAVLDATFRLNGSRESQRMYLTNFFPLDQAEELTEYAMYLFTQKTTGGKINPRYPAGFNYGVKKFTDTTGMWYYIVTLTGSDIELRLYGSEKNKAVRDGGTPREVVRGQLKGNKVVTESNPDGGEYYFIDGVLGVYSSHYRLFFEFFDSTPEGDFIQGTPQPVFTGYTATDIEKAAGTYKAPVIVRLDSATAPKPGATAAQHTQTPPSFPGGDGALNSYLNRNIRYPTAERLQNFRRNVKVSFVITHEGKIKDAKVTGTPAELEFQEEAVRLVSAMPDWKPATINGKPVNTNFILTINFYSRN